MKRIEVAAGIIYDNEKVLITRRAPKEKFAGRWEFPGGKIEVNETPQDCIARELKEELNIGVSIGEFCSEITHDYQNMHVRLFAYYCSIIEGEIEVSVHDKYKWVKANDLLKYELLPADVPIAKNIMEKYK